MSKTWRDTADEEDNELPAQSETVAGPTYQNPNDEERDQDAPPPQLRRQAREQRRHD